MQLEKGWRFKLSDDHLHDCEPVLVFIFWNGTRVEVYNSSTRLCLADAWPVSGHCLATVWPVSGLDFSIVTELVVVYFVYHCKFVIV